ncbi:hypothetical protein Adt_00074 [Abeliophyllum distichum]|uniref:Uncharacterized protein n=1 Tax=Abeliophyllum distichum TaxID=126358 RepID=A0ABD1VP17_9LAMI
MDHGLDNQTLYDLFFMTDRHSEAEVRAVKKIEDAIHTIIIKRSRPDWLPFVPGASYWVPPRRHSYGVAEIVREFSNALTEEEFNSLTTFQGWPSSAFYLNRDASSHSKGVTRSINGSSSDKEG